ncbi:hypothetical protein J7E86_30240, partial [Streptomyces sp. ISL-11]|nr:hypothetical protein [Streptomyces sp. ISL-11]
GEPRTAVLAVFQPAGESPGQVGGVRARRGARRVDAVEVTRHAELMDLVDAMATALLRAAGSGPDELLRRAAAVPHGRFADWVVVDLNDAGTLRRVVVLGPGDGKPGTPTQTSGGGRPGTPAESGAVPGTAAEGAGSLADAVARQDPARCPLVVEATAAGATAFHVRPDDAELFGHDELGAPVLVRAAVTSLLCVPLRTSRQDPVRGALTLFRTGARRPFEMAEAGAVDRMSRHVALALGALP